jgi:hypothetical protein
MLLACGDGRIVSPISELTPTPPPTPRPTAQHPKTPAPVGSVVCSIGDGSHDADCRKESSRLAGEVEAAIDLVVEEQPALFDLTQESTPGTKQYKILDTQAYLAGVIEHLRIFGLCADLDYTFMRKIEVKNTNGFSEEFEIISGNGFIRRERDGSYRKTCTPSSFPVEPDPDAPPPGSGCGKPYPLPPDNWGAKIHVRLPYYWVLDSTPRVLNRPYCAAAGFTDNRTQCAIRPDGPDRLACENLSVGIADDTGLPGPTWTRDGNYCTGEASGCEHDPYNPYALWVYRHASGIYKVCADNGVCGVVDVQF